MPKLLKLEQLQKIQYGKLTVVAQSQSKNGRTMWKCLCECGNATNVPGSSLLSGNTKSCGCGKVRIQYEDLQGQRFGRLVVDRLNHKVGKKYFWFCTCNCGGTNIVGSRDLKSGHTQSCGCYMIERIKETHTTHGESKTVEYKRNKTRKRLHKLYGLTQEDLDAMYMKQDNKCAICGVVPDGLRYNILHIDHCHTSGKVRGLLCRQCNAGLGNFKDNTASLNKAIQYLGGS